MGFANRTDFLGLGLPKGTEPRLGVGGVAVVEVVESVGEEQLFSEQLEEDGARHDFLGVDGGIYLQIGWQLCSS